MSERPVLRPLRLDDVAWVVGLAGRRRAASVPFAPRFWNPSATAHHAHTTYLSAQIASEKVLSVRTDGGFLFAPAANGVFIIDDMACEDDRLWPTDGVALLRRAARLGRLRLVCPVAEAPRAAAARRLELTVAESWWHRDLDPQAETEPRPGPIHVDGAHGRLVTAPPVYDPGGPVLLCEHVDGMPALRAIETEAERRGATVSVVAQAAGDETRAALLTAAGHRLTTDFYESPR